MDERQEIALRLSEMQRWNEEGTCPTTDTTAYIDDILSRLAPAAERLGMEHEQSLLQNLAVKLGYPEDYSYLKRLLLDSEATCEMVFRTFSVPICAMLDDMGIEYEFKYRMKSVYSIWRKMRVDHKEFDDVYDLFATRIIYKPQPITPLAPENELDVLPDVRAVKAETVAAADPEIITCWRIYAIVSMLYRIQHDRIKNWITHPKPSGYQALQMTVMGPDCNWIELQIRSERMHYEAEYGSAAHWLYKQETSVK